MSFGGIPTSVLLQMLSQQQQGQTTQPPEQMSQQGQFNPADIQAQLQGGPQPFSFASVPGGVGRNIINALANAGKAATYVAEDPRERQADDARAQQLWETKQKMSLAAGEFGQREKDRAAQVATQKGEFAQREKDRAAQLEMAKQGRTIEQGKLDETIRHNKTIESMKDDPTDKKLDAYVGQDNVQHVVMQRKDGSTYELTYGKVRQPPSGEAKPQLGIGPDNKVIELKPGMTVPQGTRTVTSELGKPNADEQRRADLAENMNENLNQLEDIVKRRPELFGQYGGGLLTSLRGTIGTGDPDIAKLKAIREYLGMASVGAHSMRNAQHVGAAADAVMAGFRNSPEAMQAAIKMARDSTATFSKDLQRSQGVSAPPSTGNSTQGPAVGAVEDGYRFKGGDPADQKNWEPAR